MLEFAAITGSTKIEPVEALVVRRAYVRQYEARSPELHSDSTVTEILAYASVPTPGLRGTSSAKRRTVQVEFANKRFCLSATSCLPTALTPSPMFSQRPTSTRGSQRANDL